MTSFLLLSNKSDATAFLTKEFWREKIMSFDQVSIVPEASIGIEEVRKLQKQLLLKPYQSPKKALIIYDAHLITREAQNALLKTLEEPPADTLIYLVSEREEAFLPTILSRCYLINLLTTEKEPFDEKEFEETIKAIGAGGVGERLYQAQLLGTKEKALPWLMQALTYFRELLLSSEDSQEHEYLIAQLEAFQEAHDVISSTNVAPRLVMENLFLNLL